MKRDPGIAEALHAIHLGLSPPVADPMDADEAWCLGYDEGLEDEEDDLWNGTRPSNAECLERIADENIPPRLQALALRAYRAGMRDAREDANEDYSD